MFSHENKLDERLNRDYLKTCSYCTISCISIIWFKFTVSVNIDMRKYI